MATYRTKGSCSREIIFFVEDDNTIGDVKFLGGCSGNLQAIARLIKGRKVEDIVPMLKGIQCRNGTSCPDQLALALIQHTKESAEKD